MGLSLILSAVLAACGGGGSDSATSTPLSTGDSITQSGDTTSAGTTTTASTTVTTGTGSTGVTFNSGADAESDADKTVSAQTPGTSASSPAVADTGTTTTSATTTTADTGTTIVNAGTTATATPPATTASTPATTTTASTSTSSTQSSSSAGSSDAQTSLIPTANAVAVSTSPMQRPAYNTGTGFFVSGTRVYDPSGMEFRIRGVNHNHWDQTGATTGIPLTGANTSRIHLDFTKSTANTLKVLNAAIGGHVMPIAGNWTGTCYADTAHLASIVDTWVAQAADLAPTLNAHGMVNIANEWGPSNSAVWRDAYITAIARMRAAGYTGTLVVDSGGCGQDVSDLVKYGAAVLASDPQRNVLFDLHVYGSFAEPATGSRQGLLSSVAALQASGLPVLIGEFGPGNNVGPSPTLISAVQVITAAESVGFGWLAWAYDDNDLAGCKTSNSWFGMVNYCATYTGKDSELTTFGLTMVPILKQLARPAATL